ncbi:hypothetical protein J8I87_08915 [Paraburkholderia sp. LEh10]|nr:hypothetical protein [Paraburkholderia sp. LEh10]MBP0589835.1 hypothetical protein [Paraburkholderia sp. LEh10]
MIRLPGCFVVESGHSNQIDPFLAFVSWIMRTLEVGVFADVRHAHQQRREAEPLRLKQRLREDMS